MRRGASHSQDTFRVFYKTSGPALWATLGRICGIDITELCDLFHSGLPILGAFFAPGEYDEKVSPCPKSVEGVISRVRAKWGEPDKLFRDDASQDVLLAKTMERGWLSGPFPSSEFSPFRRPRPGVSWLRKEKVRAVDNLERLGCDRGVTVVAPTQLPRVGYMRRVADQVTRRRDDAWHQGG